MTILTSLRNENHMNKNVVIAAIAAITALGLGWLVWSKTTD